MTAGRSGTALYTPAILALAVELSEHPLDHAMSMHGEAHSRVCGSRVKIGLIPAPDGTIARIGAQVSACAIGQAAAALFLRAAAGRNADDIATAIGEIEAWLATGISLPRWPGMAELASARPYTARHPAILLPWKAALAALSNPARSD
jgi:NifU-like protein involved in Fe-S cluster formation